MCFNGSLKLDGGGAGVLFISSKGEQLKYVFQILFKVSNNEAEYEALLHGLRLAVTLGIKRLLVYGDSLLVVQQVNKECDINKDTMDAYVEEIRKLENKFSGLKIHHVDRDNNVGADNNPSIMAVRLSEFGHDQTFNRSSRRIQSCAGSSRQVHQVDRVQAHCQDHIR